MAVETFPSFLQDEEYSAETLRHVFGSLLARGSAIGSIAGGLVAPTDMQVTAGSGMQVLVATGEAWIPGTSVSTQGGYLGRVTSSTALAISAASESNPRIDTIIAQVKDEAVAGGTDSFSVSVVTGTATSGATLGNKLGVGSVPASSLVLAYVLVPSKAVSIVSGDIENVAKPMELQATGVRQEAGAAQSFLSWGYIAGSGTVGGGSGDYTVKKTGTSTYEVVWTKEKSNFDYAVAVTPENTGAVLVFVETQNAKAFTVQVTEVKNPTTAVASAFGFIVLAAS